MISIDTVYQRVLAILNKENRGYLTPQEFNLFANQAQLEIFEQYFYDLQQFKRMRDNNTEYSNMVKLVDEKISKFKHTTNLVYHSGHFDLPNNLHKLGTVIHNNAEVEKVNDKEILYLNMSPLAKPTHARPVYVQSLDTTGEYWSLKVYPETVNSNLSCTYVRKPKTVNWSYVNVNNEALYDGANSVNFELHESDEADLVIKVLSYAGLTIKDPNITQLAEQKENIKTTQEKS